MTASTIDKKVLDNSNTYINPQGILIEIYQKVNPKTIQHAREINKDRYIEYQNVKDRLITKPDVMLKDMIFWTEDFSLYTMQGDDSFLYLGDINPMFESLDNLKKAVENLKSDKHNYSYIPDRGIDIGKIVNADTTIKVNLSELERKGILKKFDNEWSFIEIYTASRQDNKNNYEDIDPLIKPLVARVFGRGKNLKNYMQMLREEGKETTRIYTLKPSEINRIVKENKKNNVSKQNYFARACVLNGLSSLFSAGNRDVGNGIRRLRGVPLTSEAGAKKIATPKYYDIEDIVKDAGRIKGHAPEQLEDIRNILSNNNYRIIKVEQ